MKKLIITSLLFIFALTLAACSKNTTTKNNGNTTTAKGEPTTTKKQETIDPFWDKDGNGVADWQEKEITLTYATWQYNDDTQTTIDTLMLQAFMAKYPNIHVDMQIVGEDYEWDANLQSTAEAGNMPDVYLIYRLETALPYGLLADITEMYEHDADTEYIFNSVKDAGVYGGKRYAVPPFIYPQYWFVNLDILKNAGITAPEYDWTWDQMESIAAACYNESEHIVGQYGVSSYWRELPKILSGNSTWKAFAFDGERFNFDSPYFEQAFEKLTNAISTNAATGEYSTEQLNEYYYSESFQPTYGGKTAIWCAPSWEAKGYFDTMQFEWDVYPAPGGSTCGNIDIIGVSSTCKEKEAAYQLMKWMSFSEEGLITRYSLYESYSDILYKSANNYPYPVADYGIDKYGENKVWDNIPYTNAPGMTSSAMINSLKNGALWGNKEVVGWDACDTSINTYFFEIYSGTNTFAALKETINNEGNLAFSEYREALDAILNS